MRLRWNLLSILIMLIVIFLLNWQVVLRWFYPIRYVGEISAHTQATPLDPYLVAALIRVESNFQPDACSLKGATGLMQLMPETAEWVAGRLGLEIAGLDLIDPDTNIRLGTWYLMMLLEEFGGNLVVALAAYNGGRGNVARWLAEQRWNGRLDGVNDIPFLETRLYVQRVLGVYTWYVRLYRGVWPPPVTELLFLPNIGRHIESWWHRGKQILERYRHLLGSVSSR